MLDRYVVDTENERDKGPGWTSISNNEFTKFTMKRSPAKKYLEPGATVIYVNTKVVRIFKYTIHYHPSHYIASFYKQNCVMLHLCFIVFRKWL